MARRAKKKTVKVDFSEASIIENFAEGDYVGVLESIEHDADAGDAGGIKFNYEILNGKKKGKVLTNFCTLATGGLFRLRQTLEDHGIETEESTMDLDLKAIAEEIGDAEWDLTVTHTTKGDKTYTQVAVFERDEDGDTGDDSGDGEDEAPSEDEVMAMDEDELEEVVDDFDLDVDLSKVKGIKKKRQAVVDALEEGEEEGEGDEGGDSYTEDEVNAMNSKELEALAEKHDLEVELEGRIKAKRKAMIEALEEEELLEEE